MDVTPLIPEGRQIIQKYNVDGFRVSGKVYGGAILVSPTETLDWSVSSFETLSEDDFEPLAAKADDIDVVLLGTGARSAFFPPVLRAALKAKGLGIDVMDTGAACRTYNVLMAEGRRVVAALLPAR